MMGLSIPQQHAVTGDGRRAGALKLHHRLPPSGVSFLALHPPRSTADIMTSSCRWMASRMLWVTTWWQVTPPIKRSVSSSTLRAVLGSSAAVCSSSSSRRGVWGWPQQRQRLALAAGRQPHLGTCGFPAGFRRDSMSERLPRHDDAPARRRRCPRRMASARSYGHVGGRAIIGS